MNVLCHPEASVRFVLMCLVPVRSCALEILLWSKESRYLTSHGFPWKLIFQSQGWDYVLLATGCNGLGADVAVNVIGSLVLYSSLAPVGKYYANTVQA